ncbi:hypothetical protein [Lysinibacillus sp. TE18511]
MVDWSGGWATPWGIANRGTKAKIITSCDNAFVTNIVLPRDPAAKRSGSSDAHRKAPSRNGNQPHVMPKSHTFLIRHQISLK